MFSYYAPIQYCQKCKLPKEEHRGNGRAETCLFKSDNANVRDKIAQIERLLSEIKEDAAREDRE